MRLSAFGFVLLSAFWIASANARAQDAHDHARGGHAQGQRGQGHAENHDWYRELKQPGTGYSCCNGRSATSEGDCRPTRAYLNDDGMWYALLNGRWVPVPPRVVLQQLAPDGRSHICASKSGMIYCFLGGSPKS
jgi:hypothetical protein